MTWLEVLLRNGIVRLDPDPNGLGDDSFIVPEDVVRIAFQRFQDHLVVQASLSRSKDATELFAQSGPLEWLVSSPRRYAWTGHFEALSIQVPETFGTELVDILPDGADRWWREGGIQKGFAQSVRWRAITSQDGRCTFTDRSLTLLNSLQMNEEAISLLLEVAAVPEHPWNAEMLHRNLWGWKLNRRDIQWSRVIASAADDDKHPVHRLINWSIGGRLDHAGPELLRLVMIVLTWLCSTTSRFIRDAATRGLCRLLVKAPDLHHDLLALFAEVDDLYVLERLLAASYGAACQLGPDPALEKIASSTFNLIFVKSGPPRHLLARDYALGTLEVARYHGRLSPSVVLTEARPPFPTKALRAPSKERLEKCKDKIGDHGIFWSCGEHGDFGRYEIASAVNDFSATKLSGPIPLSERNRFDLFTKEAVDIDPQRQAAFEALEKASREVWSVRVDQSSNGFTILQLRSERALKLAAKIEGDFIALLNTSERERYTRDAYDRLFTSRANREPHAFDVGWAQRWVTARAYGLGWTKERFGDDRTPLDHSRQRTSVERVGKKYQWIALYELLAWLSDTHWIKGDWGQLPRPYSYPTDTAFQRDLDPTLAEKADLEPLPNETWRLDFNLQPTETDQLTAWANQNDPWQAAQPAIFREGVGQQLITLYSFQRAAERFSDKDFERREIGLRREGFLFVRSLIVSKKDLQASYEALVATKPRDGHSLEASKLTDGPFLGEYPWRETWPDLGWDFLDGLPQGVKGLKPVVEYWWESHLDASRPEGVSFYLPAPELIRLMGLKPPSARSPHVIKDNSGRNVIVHHTGDEKSFSVSIRKDAFEQFLFEQELGCLWFVFGERSAWPTGGHREYYPAVVWKPCLFRRL